MEQDVKGLLASYELHCLIESGVIVGPDEKLLHEQVNQTSIDITLGDEVLVEHGSQHLGYTAQIVLRDRKPLRMDRVTIPDSGFVLRPGQFILACSREKFNLPLDVSAEYKLKSSMARIGLEHMNAGWCDPGWHDSVLTLELKNMTEFHAIRLHKGDRIGQVVFFHHLPVSEKDSYAVKGRYNGHSTVEGIKP